MDATDQQLLASIQAAVANSPLLEEQLNNAKTMLQVAQLLTAALKRPVTVRDVLQFTLAANTMTDSIEPVASEAANSRPGAHHRAPPHPANELTASVT